MNSKPDNDNIKQLINKLVEDIIETEDKIAILTKNLSSLVEKNKLEYTENLNFDLAKNNEAIQMLNKFIISEKDNLGKEIQKRENEISKLNNTIIDIEKEVAELTMKEKEIELNEVRLEKLDEMVQKKNDELKLLEKMLTNNNETKQGIERSLTELSNAKKEIEECVSMLKEERLSVEVQIINLISQKESLEEIVIHNSISFFQTESNERVDHNVALMTNIAIGPFEIEKINVAKLTDQIYELLFDYSPPPSKSNTSDQLIFFEKETLYTLIKNITEAFANDSISNHILYSVNDFFTLLTKKIYDRLCKIQNDRMNEIDFERLKLFMKYLLKCNYYDILISEKIYFINKEYKIVKKEKMESIININTKISNLLSKLDEIGFKEKEIRQNIKVILDASVSHLKDHSPYSGIITKFNQKVHTLIGFKRELENELILLDQKGKMKIKAYEDQIKEIEKLNALLEDKKKEVDKQVEESQLSTNEEIVYLRETIAEKFQIIKDQLKKYREVNNSSQSKMQILNEYINKINQTLQMKFTYTDCTSNQRNHYRVSSDDNCSHESSESELPKLDDRNTHGNSVYMTAKEYRNLHEISPGLEIYDRRSIHKKSKSHYEVWNRKEKFLNTINNLKNQNVMKKNNSQLLSDDKDIIAYKIKPLLSPTFCYLRNIIDKTKLPKFNPIEAYSPEQCGFVKYTISLDQKISKLLFYKHFSFGNEVDFEMKLIDIQNTAVNNTIKDILTIYNSFKHQRKEVTNIEDFVRREEFDKTKFDFNSRIKCLFNKYFNFSLLIRNEIRIELIFLNYDDFKNWLNGIAFLLKHKSQEDEFKIYMN